METLARHFHKLAGASFASRGRAIADLMQHWPAVVGERLASISRPERMKWPKTVGPEQQGGILIIKSAPGHALDLQHETQLIIERINSYLGFGAVSCIRIQQSSRAFADSKIEKNSLLSPEVSHLIDRKLESIADDKLKAALRRLGSGALARRTDSPQPK
jgi:hypothetical protein